MSDKVRVSAYTHIDEGVEYELIHSSVAPTDTLFIGDSSVLFFASGALRKLQAAIDVYLMGQHTQSKEDWQAEAVDAEAK